MRDGGGGGGRGRGCTFILLIIIKLKYKNYFDCECREITSSILETQPRPVVCTLLALKIISAAHLLLSSSH